MSCILVLPRYGMIDPERERRRKYEWSVRNQGNQEVTTMPAETALPTLIAEQLAAFERLQPEFAASFHYVQEVQGQRRLPTFPIEASVRYPGVCVQRSAAECAKDVGAL